MDTTYTFSSARRRKHALLLVAIAVVVALPVLLLAARVHPLFLLGAVVPAWIAWRGVTYLSGGKEAVTIDVHGLTRSGMSIPWNGAELELRTVPRREGLEIEQVILWPPHRPDQERIGVGFDDSLDKFEQAVRTITARLPEMRVRVSTATERDIRDDRRELVLARIRPTPAERALLDLGRSALSRPPHLRN